MADSVRFPDILKAVSACDSSTGPVDLIDGEGDILLTAAELLVATQGVSIDHREELEGAVAELMQLLRHLGAGLSFECDDTPALIIDSGQRVHLSPSADAEETFATVARHVDPAVARVLVLSPFDITDTYGFVVLSPSQLEAFETALGRNMDCLLRDFDHPPIDEMRFRVIEVPTPDPDKTGRRDIGHEYRIEGRHLINPRGHRTVAADPASARAIDPLWVADSKRVYFVGMAVRGADPRSFAVIEGSFGHDADRVFYCDFVVEADPDTFALFAAEPMPRPERWGRDSDDVFYFENYVKKVRADPETFRVMGCHATDGKSVWARGSKLRPVHAPTWERLPGHFWSRDRSRVYHYSHRLKNATPAAFEPVLEHWSMDDERVFSFSDEATPEEASSKARATYAFVASTRLLETEPWHTGNTKLHVEVKCRQWLRRPSDLCGLPDDGVTEMRSWCVDYVPEWLDGDRILVAEDNPWARPKGPRVLGPGPAWEHQVPQRLSVMERFLALADD